MDLFVYNKKPRYNQIFHLINSKNLPGEFYVTIAPGFQTLPLLILLKMCELIFQIMYCQQSPFLLQ